MSCPARGLFLSRLPCLAARQRKEHLSYHQIGYQELKNLRICWPEIGNRQEGTPASVTVVCFGPLVHSMSSVGGGAVLSSTSEEPTG